MAGNFNDAQNKGPDMGAPKTTPRPLLTLVVALSLAAFYVFMSWYLLKRFALDNPLPDTSWQRALIIYNGIASVGFAAIGVLLGSSVQQVNLGVAHQQAADARQDAARKTATISDALHKLTADVRGGPGDLGGGPAKEETRVAEARSILLAGLQK